MITEISKSYLETITRSPKVLVTVFQSLKNKIRSTKRFQILSIFV